MLYIILTCLIGLSILCNFVLHLKYQYQTYSAPASPSYLPAENASMMSTNSGVYIVYHILVVFFIILTCVQWPKKQMFFLESTC